MVDHYTVYVPTNRAGGKHKNYGEAMTVNNKLRMRRMWQAWRSKQVLFDSVKAWTRILLRPWPEQPEQLPWP